MTGSYCLLYNLQTDIGSNCGMCEGADGNQINPRLCNFPDIFKFNISGCFKKNPALRGLYSHLHIIQRHVVQHHNSSAGFYCIPEVVQGSDFHLDLRKMVSLLCSPYSFLNASRRFNMVIFYENSIIKSEPVVTSSPYPHSILFHESETRRCFSRVKNFRLKPLYFLRIHMRQGSNAGEALKYVEACPLS